MVVRWRHWILGASALLVGGCSGPLEIPPLPGAPAEPAPTVFQNLHTLEDFRTLLGHLNRRGRYDAFRPYLEAPSDNELRSVVPFLSRHLHDETLNPEGLVALLDRRFAEGHFTSLHPHPPEVAAALSGGLAHWFVQPEFPSLVVRASALLSPPWARAWERAQSAAGPAPSAPAAQAEPWATEFRALLTATDTWDALARLETAWEDGHFPRGLLRGLNLLARWPGGTQALGEGIAALAAPQPSGTSEGERLIALLRELRGPSNGLFRVPQEKLKKEPHALRELADHLTDLIPRALGGYVREGLQAHLGTNAIGPKVARLPDGNPSPAWVDTFIVIRRAVENITGTAADEFAPDAVLKNLPLYLNSYTLVRWLEGAALLWDDGGARRAQASQPAGEIVLAGPDAAGDYVVDPRVVQDFTALGLGEFLTELEGLVARPGYGEFRMEIPALAKATFIEALQEMVDTTHRLRPFADGAPWIRALVFGLTRDDGGFGFSLGDLETDDTLRDLHRWLLSPSPTQGSRLLSTLLRDWGLGDLPSDTRDILLSLYDGHPALRARVESLLGRVSSLDSLVVERPGGRTLAEAYLTLVQSTTPEEASGWSALWEALGRGRWLEGAGHQPRFPHVVASLRTGHTVARWAKGWGALSAAEQRSLADGLGTLLAPEGAEVGTRFWQRIFTEAEQKSPEALHWLLEQTYLQGWEVIPDLQTIYESERRWLGRAVEQGEWLPLWELLRRRGSAASAQEALRTLQNWERTGYLDEALDRLAHFRGDRLQALTQTLQRARNGGELGGALSWGLRWISTP